MTTFFIQGEPGPLRSDRSRRKGHFLLSKPCSLKRRLRARRPCFKAYRAGTCTQPVHFESVYVYVYSVEPNDDAFSSPPTLRLCR